MPDLPIDLNPNAILALVAYATVTGVLNLLLSERSRVDAWAESKPRLAALLKILRGVGFDPWHLVAAAALLFKGRLPKTKPPKGPPPAPPSNGDTDTTVSIIPPNTKLPKPPEPDDDPPAAAMLAFAIGLVMVGCAGTTTPPKAPCDPATLALITAECSAAAFECGKSGKSEAECTAECDQRLDERAEVCRE